MAIDFDETLPAPPTMIKASLLEASTWGRYAELTGALSHDFESQARDQGLATLFRRSMSTDELVPPLRRLLGRMVDIHEEVRWNEDAEAPSAVIRVEIRRPQVKFGASLVVEEVTGGGRLRVHGPDPRLPLLARPFMPQARDVMETALGKLCDAVREGLQDA